jgi:GUN4-like
MNAKKYLTTGITCFLLSLLISVGTSLFVRTSFTDSSPDTFIQFLSFIILITSSVTQLLSGVGLLSFTVGLILAVVQKPPLSSPQQSRWKRFMAVVILAAISWTWLIPVMQRSAGDLLFWVGYQTPSTDYSKLEMLLKTKQWKEADDYTSFLIRSASDTRRESLMKATLDSFKQLPCADFQALDQLWLKYSNNRFGFTVQRNAFEAIYPQSSNNFPFFSRLSGNSSSLLYPPNHPNIRRMAMTRKNNPNQFKISDPIGSLPSSGLLLGSSLGIDNSFTYSIYESVDRQRLCGLSKDLKSN